MNFAAFTDSLQYMGRGMLGIFVVIGVIIAATYLINRFAKDEAEE